MKEESRRRDAPAAPPELSGEEARLYRLLRDDLSKKIFLARLRCDRKRNMTTVMELAYFRSDIDEDEARRRAVWRERLEEIAAKNGKLILYGTRLRGPSIAWHLMTERIPFYGFCGRRAAEFPDGLMGKPVVSPQWLFAHAEECYVSIASANCYDEIRGILREHAFPEDHILTCFDPMYRTSGVRQYFEFPELFPKGGAFVDGGSYDASTAVEFAEWCGGSYSGIFAFEPEQGKPEVCRRNLEAAGIHDYEVVAAALSDREGTVRFFGDGTGGSHVMSEQELRSAAQASREGRTEEVRTVRLDDVVGDCRIGMIKMDIEGAEFAALHGAANTIRRDRPLLAICVYHRPGDVTAIMSYCRELVPEYDFWLRQYDAMGSETVLYAAVERRMPREGGRE